MNSTLKALRELIKKNERFYIHGTRDHDSPSYNPTWTFQVTGAKKVGDKEILTKVEVKGKVSNGHTSKRQDFLYEGKMIPKYSDDPFVPQKGFWGGLYENFKNIIRVLPNDCEPEFHVLLDSGTSQVLIEQGLHSDYLYIRAKRGDTRTHLDMTFLVDVANGRHNSARFGSPRHDTDTVGYGG